MATKEVTERAIRSILTKRGYKDDDIDNWYEKTINDIDVCVYLSTKNVEDLKKITFLFPAPKPRSQFYVDPFGNEEIDEQPINGFLDFMEGMVK